MMTMPEWIEYRDRNDNLIASFSHPMAVESAMRLIEEGVLTEGTNFKIFAFDREGMPVELNPKQGEIYE